MDHLNMNDSFLPWGKPNHPPWKATHAPAPYKGKIVRYHDVMTTGGVFL